MCGTPVQNPQKGGFPVEGHGRIPEMGKFTPSKGCKDAAPTAPQHILNQFATSEISLPHGAVNGCP